MPRLYRWYIDRKKFGEKREVLSAHGVVTGHTLLRDTTFINTSEVKSVHVNRNDVVIQTENTRYECRMEDADYKSFKETELIPNYELFRGKYEDGEKSRKTIPELEENSALIILGNNREYYFDSFYAKHNGKTISILEAKVHIGTFQDSVLCRKWIGERYINYDYFPYQGLHIEFYSWKTDMETYIENCGDKDLHVSAINKVFKIHPSERKHIILENAEENKPELYRIDLYNIWDNGMD